jgi:hypothetical protein
MAKAKKTTKEIEKKPVIIPAKPRVTYLGEGSVSGEYLFAEIPGSVSASSKDEAIKKAIATINSRPDLEFAK